MTPQPKDTPGRRIRGVKIAFDIIDMLQSANEMGVTAIADELEYSKSTIHSHVKTLEDLEMLVEEDSGYRLSLRILDMANHIQEQVGNYTVIEEEVRELADETGEIVQFGIEEHGKVSYLCKVSGDRAVVTESKVGQQQPMYSTSLGKTILAYLPADKRESVIRSCEFTPRTSQTITDPDTLRTELDRTRERGYGIDDEENIEGLRCVSAPVESGGTVLGAISISGPSSRFTDARLHDELPEYVQRAANVIELNTKYST